jgi:hypothetical protein
MLLDNEQLQRMVDYSFGDHSGVLGGCPNAYMREASYWNREFTEFVFNFKRDKVMTLFIDNIRLYKRPLEYSDWLHNKPISASDREILDQYNDEDLLLRCSVFPFQKFIIFTAFEDTPLDDYIWAKIPDNVLAIHSANGVVFGGKVHPFPHGLERKMTPDHNNQAILESYIDDKPATKLLYVNHREDTGDRKSLRELFSWATVSPKVDYETYLSALKDHKFVLCPSGNGIESARNWETLYMKRVPVMLNHPYLREVMKDFNVLFVEKWEDVTPELLEKNDHLYQNALKMNPDLLDLEKIYDLRLRNI